MDKFLIKRKSDDISNNIIEDNGSIAKPIKSSNKADRKLAKKVKKTDEEQPVNVENESWESYSPYTASQINVSNRNALYKNVIYHSIFCLIVP